MKFLMSVRLWVGKLFCLNEQLRESAIPGRESISVPYRSKMRFMGRYKKETP